MELPVYYTYKKKGKTTTMLIGLNEVYNMHFAYRNKMIKWFHNEVSAKLKKLKLNGKVSTHYKYFYKNSRSDAPNVVAVIDKMFMDVLQECKIIKEDNVENYVKSSWEVGGKDIKNPRIEVTLFELA